MRKINCFGRAFRELRTVKGLTQEDFAHVSGRTYVGEVERGLKHPTLQKIDELAGPLELHPLALVALAYLESVDASALDELLAHVREQLSDSFDFSR